mmetsp:Transcript_31743/g.45125  ORF Transcript_31743/g.45125 Transcript_31743/m.45125 type:complete len:115 (+) Transcript_31743:107-451(+)
MKDPIRVAPSQIELLERLTYNRIDPVTCQEDTAGRLRDVTNSNNSSDSNSTSVVVDVNRPIQTTTNKHRVVFCECVDWVSKRERDQEWCQRPMKERGVLYHKRGNVTNAPTAAP